MSRDTELSPRVLEAIKESDAASEMLLSWVQVAFLAFMTLLYFLAPKGFSQDVPFEPIPFALALYAPCMLIRFILAYTRRLTGAVLAVSVLVDIAFILGLIYAFHIQYQQPAAFYLKAPTFCYLSIFIALRSLRYDLRYIVMSGLAAILGWVLLVYLAIQDHGVITRNYVEYITGTRVLIGAEVDKLIYLAVLTTILSIGIMRARRMLSRSEAESLAKQELSRFFSPDVAQKIIYSEARIQPGDGDLCEAATLMMDLRSFTKLSTTITPHQVMQLLADYQARMVPRILDHAGSIDKFLGDGILAHFGAAVPSSTYAADTLRAAEALVETAHEWSMERALEGLPQVRVGVACAHGTIIFGAVGDESRLEFTVIGESVNLSAKLEKHTKVTQVDVLTTRELFDLAIRQGYDPRFNVIHYQQEIVDGVALPLDLVGFKYLTDKNVTHHEMSASA